MFYLCIDVAKLDVPFTRWPDEVGGNEGDEREDGHVTPPQNEAALHVRVVRSLEALRALFHLGLKRELLFVLMQLERLLRKLRLQALHRLTPRLALLDVLPRKNEKRATS